jgi:hypothetical protein
MLGGGNLELCSGIMDRVCWPYVASPTKGRRCTGLAHKNSKKGRDEEWGRAEASIWGGGGDDIRERAPACFGVRSVRSVRPAPATRVCVCARGVCGAPARRRVWRAGKKDCSSLQVLRESELVRERSAKHAYSGSIQTRLLDRSTCAFFEYLEAHRR